MIDARAQKEMIPVEESFAAWCKDPKYVAAYEALADEFSLGAPLIEPRRLGKRGKGEPGSELRRMHARKR